MKIFTLVCALLVNSFLLKAQNQLTLIPFSTGYTSPLGVENCGDSRIFILQQSGQIIICDSTGKKRSKPFLDISDRIRNGGEQGLLGLAFDPAYLSNGFFYVYYINISGNTQVSRFRVKNGNSNLADTGSEKFILQVLQPFSNHNGGNIHFGPDGYLYIGMGDGGSGGDPNNNAQNTMSLLGKMLRIDVHHGNPYAIPATNPFVDSSNYKPEIWALGLRNPWRWSFDALTGAMVIGDVGQDNWEEVDFQYPGKGGQNYGWRCYEGAHDYNTSGCKPPSQYISPVYEYPHSDVTGDCSITGGFVYRGGKYPSLYGKYFFADYCSGIIRSLFMDAKTLIEQDVLDTDNSAYTSFGEDHKHELYVTDFSTGSIYQLTAGPVVQQNIPATDYAKRLTVLPNPSKGNIIIRYNAEKAQQIIIRIQNITGQLFYSAIKPVSSGNNSWNINLQIPKGSYYLSLKDEAGNTVNKQLIIE